LRTKETEEVRREMRPREGEVGDGCGRRPPPVRKLESAREFGREVKMCDN
jgi:hypothetical protein